MRISDHLRSRRTEAQIAYAVKSRGRRRVAILTRSILASKGASSAEASAGNQEAFKRPRRVATGRTSPDQLSLSDLVQDPDPE